MQRRWKGYIYIVANIVRDIEMFRRFLITTMPFQTSYTFSFNASENCV